MNKKSKDKLKDSSKEKSDKILKELTIESIKDIEKIFEGIGSLIKKMWNIFTNPIGLIEIFKLQKIDSIYDKFLKNEKLMKALAFIVALLVVMSTRYTPSDPIRPSIPISNYPVIIREDQNYVIVDDTIPETVTVTLSGERTHIELARTRANFEIYVDLRGLGPGTHTVELQYSSISDRVDVNINPSTIVVTLAELVEEERAVTADFMNRESLDEWYALGSHTLNLNTVKIRGAKSIVEEIASVRALIDLNNDIESLVGYDAQVVAFDRHGQRLNVEIIPSTLTASVEIMKKSEVVPFKVSTTGNPPEGYSISEIIVDPVEIELFGERAALDSIEYFPISVDLYQLNENNEIWVDLDFPDDIQALSKDRIKVSVIFEETETEVLNDIAINIRNLELGYEIDLSNLEDLIVDVTLRGAPNILDQISESHIDVFVDLSGLGVGQHEVRIEINTPEFVSGTLSERRIKVNIKE